jgi:hypothetical protein
LLLPWWGLWRVFSRTYIIIYYTDTVPELESPMVIFGKPPFHGAGDKLREPLPYW